MVLEKPQNGSLVRANRFWRTDGLLADCAFYVSFGCPVNGEPVCMIGEIERSSSAKLSLRISRLPTLG
jgi:hypothetical protein